MLDLIQSHFPRFPFDFCVTIDSHVLFSFCSILQLHPEIRLVANKENGRRLFSFVSQFKTCHERQVITMIQKNTRRFDCSKLFDVKEI